MNKAINPAGFPRAGYSNAVVSTGARRIALAGQTDMDAAGAIRHPGDLVAQVDGAFANIATVLKACDAKPGDMTRMRIYVLDADGYAANAKAIGAAYRSHFGKWYPAMTLLQVSRLYDADALVEIEVDAIAD